MKEFRTLYAREIVCRAQQIRANGLVLLLYKDARCDQNVLDETVGPLNWMRQHSRDNANCTVSIWDDDKKMWVSKEDTGTESNMEAQKGLASDSFKRACVNWGIGRELYTAPFIWIPSRLCEIKRLENGKFACYDRFKVADVGYNNLREIERLTIVNEKTGNTAFIYVKGTSDPPNTEAFECEKCKKEITGTVGKDGKPITPWQLVAYSRKNFNGGTYCDSCQRILFDVKKERERENVRNNENAG